MLVERHLLRFVNEEYLYLCCRYPMDDNVSLANTKLNYIFTFYFLAEMFMRLAGMGLRCYVKDRQNIFDAVIVVSSIVEVVIDISPLESGESTKYIVGIHAIYLFVGCSHLWHGMGYARLQTLRHLPRQIPASFCRKQKCDTEY